MLAGDYVSAVRKAIADVKNIYIPSKNRELFEAAAVFYGVANKCGIPIHRDLSRYYIKTTDGGEFIAFIELPSNPMDADYVSAIDIDISTLWSCGGMTRQSEKYPVYSWSVDTRYCAREGGWQNNLTSDYEYLYEFMTGAISDNIANSEKFERLRKRKFITGDNKINIMIAKGKAEDFFDRIPSLGDEFKKKFADHALEAAEIMARNYPPQMRELIISWYVGGFISNCVAVMVMDILYKNGTFQPLTDDEKVTSNLIMFCDVTPEDN